MTATTINTAETTRTAVEFQGDSQVGFQTLGAWFGQTARRFADRIAVRSGSHQMTYGELLDRADYLAALLNGYDVGPGVLVAIHMDRSVEMVIAMLGVVRAGAAYLPLDPKYPEARIRETLADAQPAGVIVDRERAARIVGATPRVLIFGELPPLPPATPAVPLREAQPADGAYIIYTSGSTGRPKGVCVTQRNVVRLFQQTARWFHFGPDDVWTMFHSFAFDFSVWEIWGALLYGGRLVIVPYAVSRAPEEFLQLLADERVTVLNQTPTAFSLLMAADTAAHAAGNAPALSLRTIVFGGEALNLRSLGSWFARHGDARPKLVNMYGITETTVHVTHRRIRADEAACETDSLIGEPISDLRIELVDSDLKPVANGEVGEMVIGGPGVANGYLNRPELTAERFLTNPAGERLYRSGDLARRRPDGELVYLGRADQQVKINGFRIELGEIEGVLASAPGVRQVCAVPRGAAGEERLAVYIVADAAVSTEALGVHAAAHLPPQMRPAFYTRLDRLPLDTNGKVDRRALPAPSAIAEASRPAVTPRTTEERIGTVWRELLGTDAFADGTGFFEAGGSSLLVIRLRMELERLFGVKIPVTALFEYTTVQTQAALVSGLSGTVAAAPERRTPAGAASRAEQQRAAMARLRAMRKAGR